MENVEETSMPLMVDVTAVQQRLAEAARQTPCRFERQYRTLCDVKWLTEAWRQIRKNKGSITSGVDGETRDDVDETLILNLSERLKKGEYKPRPVRRVYIPKSNGKLRPLGIPTIQDRIVQSALKMILEPIWEQDFRDCSHGFRPGRSCHTALNRVAKRFARSTWIIEGDISGCFDNIPHGKLLECIRRRIRDEKLVQLVNAFLKAGYLEQWQYHRTYSGTPQGGIISPLLANIFLHELDVHMEESLNANLMESKQEKNARRNPESRKLENRILRIRKKLDAGDLEEGERAELISELKVKTKERKKTPNLLFRQKVGYVRYADDFLIILQGYPKAKALEIREEVGRFMQEELGLTLNQEKTLITHPSKKIQFLGYDLLSKGGRSKRIRLEIPKKAEDELIQKVSHICRMHHIDEADLIVATNSIVRGWMEYYKYASAPQRIYSDVLSKVFWLTAHYIARKHQTSMPKVLQNRTEKMTRKGRTRTVLTTRVGEKVFSTWCFPPQTASIYQVKTVIADVKPLFIHRWVEGRSLEERLLALQEAENRCEECGSTENLEVHHIGGLKGKVGKARRQAGKDKPKRVLCNYCHLHIAHGGNYAA